MASAAAQLAAAGGSACRLNASTTRELVFPSRLAKGRCSSFSLRNNPQCISRHPLPATPPRRPCIPAADLMSAVSQRFGWVCGLQGKTCHNRGFALLEVQGSTECTGGAARAVQEGRGARLSKRGQSDGGRGAGAAHRTSARPASEPAVGGAVVALRRGQERQRGQATSVSRQRAGSLISWTAARRLHAGAQPAGPALQAARALRSHRTTWKGCWRCSWCCGAPPPG